MIILICCFSIPVFAQENTVEMADVLRESGKINTVVAVLAIVFAVLAVYLFMIDRKLTKLEQEIKNKK